MSKKWHIISYDIREPDRLRKVAKRLSGYGSRLQFSVFKCNLNDREVKRLQWEITRILKPEDDFLIISLCSHCTEKVSLRHADKEIFVQQELFEII